MDLVSKWTVILPGSPD